MPMWMQLKATLRPVYADSPPGYVMYNDEPPTSFCAQCWSPTLAHAKGVIAFNRGGGFWLMHSAPKFPDSPANSSYGGIYPSQMKHAQNFLCISLNATFLDAIGHVLQVTNLFIYSPSSLAADLAAAFPNLHRLVMQGQWPLQPAAQHRHLKLASSGGEPLLAFTHSSTGYDGDRVRLFEDMLEPALQTGMLVQSWSEGEGNDLPSYCGLPQSLFASENIEGVSINGTGLSWPCRHAEDRDHSKWAVSIRNAASDTGSVCIADQNRAQTQEVRGGSSICFTENQPLWEAFNDIINSVEPCAQRAMCESADCYSVR
ncbi:hypothetical protein WJX73_008867 [Symbiochloris irregularis]|uniref:Uncharacterized protein n=1 Tax=Symbiochloris irregularis TaxID=706552 RepID=A0AAW1P878_9CHLO